jgi:type IV secretory pathway VirB2 component (pilin)
VRSFTNKDLVSAPVRLDFNTGPAGTLMMIVGLLLAGSSAYTAVAMSGWRLLPSILIGLSLMAVGYSLVARARRARSRSDGADGD